MVNHHARTRRHDIGIYLPSIGPLLSGDRGHGAGGAEVQMLFIAKGLAALGARVCIVAGGRSGSMPEIVDGVDVVWRSPYRLSAPPTGKLAEFREIYASIAAADADIVITRTAMPATALLAVSARLQGRSFVYSFANDSEFELERVERKRRNIRLVELAIRMADVLIAQNERQRVLCEGVYRRPSLVIKSAAEPGELTTQKPEAFLWAGRVVSYKRPLAFIELARAVPEAHFWMMAVPRPGEENQRLLASVRRAAKELRNLELLDPRPRSEVLPVLERAVAIVNTSDFEGLSNTFLEAWSRGVPALSLAHDPDGLIERLGLGGFARGSAAELAYLAREFWQARESQHALARRCRRYVLDEHRPETIYRQWFDMLRSLRAIPTSEPALAGAAA
jgi:glycosyltransferase involved in cell wall biosynthesis